MNWAHEVRLCEPRYTDNDVLENLLDWVFGLAVVALGVTSGAHALLHKRDPRSQLGWVIACLTLPGLGPIGYWVFGNNRIHTQMRRWHERGRFSIEAYPSYGDVSVSLATQHPERAATLSALLNISARVTERPLLGGNLVELLHDGEEAYPAMLEAIATARHSIYLSTYIFETDVTGRSFIDALVAARDRGVDVRVLVDAVGERYSRPRVSGLLGRHGISVARFLPLSLSSRGLGVNLRNHRKILVVDQSLGFTGGMNIGGRHLAASGDNPRRTRDIHFRVQGPAVTALTEVFFEDWSFTTGQEPSWAPLCPYTPTGRALCRGIKDGPNEDFERLQWIIVGALSCARQRVRIMTPYFIPSRELLAALNAAVLRGTTVQIALPERSNLPVVDWACRAFLGEVMQYGIQVFLEPPPFNHSKMLLVDDFYVLVGSANLDPRSLRLNFEFNLEVYDDLLGQQLAQHFARVLARSRQLSATDLEARPLAIQLRDAAAKLFSPYL
jgi:cardiolipin synthase